MSNKILSITLAQPKETTLPDGVYVGKYSGYIISLIYNDKHYELKTEEGIRGGNIPVVVTIKSGIATFEMINN